MCDLKRGLAVTEMQSQQKCKRSGVKYLRGPRAVEGASRHLAMDGSLHAACSLLQAWFASRRRRAPSAVQPRSSFPIRRPSAAGSPTVSHSVLHTSYTDDGAHTLAEHTGHYTRGVLCVLRERHQHRQKCSSQRGIGGDPHSRPRERRLTYGRRRSVDAWQGPLLRPRSQPCLPPP